MTRLWLSSVLIFLYLSGYFYNSAQSLKPVSYQVHSWNDLSLWPNGFKQGMTHIKIDAHFIVDSTFCFNQKQVVSNASNGCFLLSHDPPQPPRQYNSTDNVLQFIQQNTYRFNSSSSTVFLAICFKLDYRYPCDNSSIASKWRSSVTALMNTFTLLITKYKLTMQIVLDGDASLDDVDRNQCLAHLWAPFIKTFVGDPSNPIATSDNHTLGYDRFSVLDTRVEDAITECTKSFDHWVQFGFEKFNHTEQPWLWWEPSSQDCIRELVTSYNESNFLHQSGFYFAINIDIPRFKVYSGYNAWNEPMKWMQSTDINHTSHVIGSFISTTGDIVIVSFVSIHQSDLSFYSVSVASGTVANDLNISQWMILNNTCLNGNTLTAVTSVLDASNGWQLFGISTHNGLLCLLWMDRTTFQVKHILNYILIPSTCDSQSMDMSSVYLQWSGSLWMVTQVFVCDESLFGLQRWRQNKNGSWNQLGDMIRIEDASAKDINGVSVVALGNAHIVVWSAHKSVYGVVIDDNVSMSAMMIGVGDRPRLSIHNSTIVMVHENAYCWISEEYLKQASPSTCNADPVSMDGVLAFTVGTVHDWIDKLMSNDSLGIVSACDPYLIHGMYDGGHSPYATVFVDSNDEQGIVSMHQGIRDFVDGDSDLHLCGAPVRQNDFMLDSWNVY
eukprot:225208_1